MQSRTIVDYEVDQLSQDYVATAEFTQSVNNIILDLSKGNGGLIRRLSATTKDDLGDISEGINTFIAHLQTLMSGISAFSEHIAAARAGE